MTYESGPPRRGLYRSRDGMIFGVCRGVADYLDFSAGWLRAILVAAAVMTGFWLVVGLYVLAGLIMRLEPAMPFRDDSDEEFYQTYASSRSLALQRLKRTYDNLERRIQRMEAIVTARDFDWERRLREGRE